MARIDYKVIKFKWKMRKPKRGEMWIFDITVARQLGVTPVSVSYMRSEMGCVLYTKKNETRIQKFLKRLKYFLA